MDPRGAGTGKWAGALDERDHELRSALCGIEAVAEGLNGLHDRLTTAQLAELTAALVSEARRMQSMLTPRAVEPTVFDLAEAIRPVITSFRTMGFDVRMAVPSGIEVHGRRDDTAQAVFTLLDNARKHAAMSAIDVRATVHAATTLYVEDDGIGISSTLCERLFEHGVRGEASAGRGPRPVHRPAPHDRTGRNARRRATNPAAVHRSALGFRSSPTSSPQRIHSIPLLATVLAR